MWYTARERKKKTHLKIISFFSHLAGGWGFPGRPVFWLGGMLEKQSKCQRRDISAEKSEKVSINWWQIGKNQCKIYIKNVNQFCVDFLTENDIILSVYIVMQMAGMRIGGQNE